MSLQDQQIIKALSEIHLVVSDYTLNLSRSQEVDLVFSYFLILIFIFIFIYFHFSIFRT